MTSRDELLKLTPERYLAKGYRDERGEARRELTTLWATAAAEQLRARGVTAAALDPVVAGATTTGKLPANAPAAASDLVRACERQVKSDADRPPFHEHLGAVLRLLALSESTAVLNAQPVPKR